MRDLFGNEVTMEQARALARRKPPTDRQTLIALRTERGMHPHNGLPLHRPPGETCGSCAHHQAIDYHGRVYHKCKLSKRTHGAATDIRVRWPACAKWEFRCP